jgi:hypothetical protein
VAPVLVAAERAWLPLSVATMVHAYGAGARPAYFVGDAPPHMFNPSAELVVEIVSPGDESRLKYEFYFRMGVAEVVIVDPEHRTVEWFVRDSSGFRPTERGNLLDISATALTELINWPQ